MDIYGKKISKHEHPNSPPCHEMSVSSINFMKSFLKSPVFKWQMWARICISLSFFSLGFSFFVSSIVASQFWLGGADLHDHPAVCCPFSRHVHKRWPCFQHLKQWPSFFNFSHSALVSFYSFAMSTCMASLSCCFFFGWFFALAFSYNAFNCASQAVINQFPQPARTSDW